MASIQNFFDNLLQAISDFFITILIYVHYFFRQTLPFVAVGSIVLGVLILITIHNVKSIRRTALFWFVLIIPFVCCVLHYSLAIGLSIYSAGV